MSYLKGELAVVLGVAGLGLGITYWRRARPELRIDPYTEDLVLCNAGKAPLYVNSTPPVLKTY